MTNTQPPPKEVTDVPLIPLPGGAAQSPPPSGAPKFPGDSSSAPSGLFDLSQIPTDPSHGSDSSTHTYSQEEEEEEKDSASTPFDYSTKTVIFYKPCSSSPDCKRPLLTNLKDVMFKYDKNRNINVIKSASEQKKEASKRSVAKADTDEAEPQ